MGKTIDYSYTKIINNKGLEVEIKEKISKINGFNIYRFICPYCNSESKGNISNIKRGSGCKNCQYDRYSESRLKTHEEYINELKIKNPLVKPIDVYKGDSIKIKHICPICKRTDWMVSPSNVLKGTHMCIKCNNNINNSVFSEISQQYLSKMGLAEIEYDIGYKTLSYYDLYISNENLLIEIQSEYHDTKLELDIKKKEFAKNKGYKVEWVDIRTTDLLSFIQRFNKKASWDEILSIVDLSKILVKKIVQLDIDGNFFKLWNGGMSEINKVLSLSISKLSLASRGIYEKQGHYYSGYLWYLLEDYILDDFTLQKVTNKQIKDAQDKSGLYLYVAKNNNDIITANTGVELAKLIKSNPSLISACLSGKRKHTKGYIITREIKEIAI